MAAWLLSMALLVLCLGGAAEAATRFVSPEGKAGNTGSRMAPWSLGKANAAAQPGDTVVLLDGIYKGVAIAPERSGAAGRPITYRAEQARKAVLTESPRPAGPFADDDSEAPAAIALPRRSHVVVDGITIRDPGGRFIYAEGAAAITIQNSLLENTEYPQAWESCRFKRVGDHIVFRNNVVRRGNDSVAITGGRFHLIEGNTFEGASHTCLVLMGVQQSVVRGNRLSNPIQKLMEVFTARRRDVGDVVRKSEHVVIEDNVFGPAPYVEINGTSSGSGSAGIQYAGNDSIVRRNVFVKCGMGMDFTIYNASEGEDPEAHYCAHNRFYHNTVYDCGWPARYGSGPGVWISGGREGIGDNVLVNNLLYHNHAHPDAHFPAETPYDVQLAFADPTGFVLRGNLLMGRQAGAVTVWDKAKKRGYTLRAFEEQFPGTAHGNREAEPCFASVEKGDFRLRGESPGRDAGLPLTTARAAGQGTRLAVEDVRYFSDGFGLVPPDVLRIGKERVRAVKVDYATNTLTLDRSLSWSKGEGVSLDYQGAGPDLGAAEFGGEGGG